MIVEKVADMDKPRGLFGYALNEYWMAMPQRIRRDALNEVEIGTSGFIPHARALTAREGEMRTTAVAVDDKLLV